MKTKKVEKIRNVVYGTITIETRVGDIKLSFQKGYKPDDNSQINTLDSFKKFRNLTDKEQDELFNLANKEFEKI